MIEHKLIEGESLETDLLSGAITNTTINANSASGLTELILQDHLKKLCKMQRKELKKTSENINCVRSHELTEPEMRALERTYGLTRVGR